MLMVAEVALNGTCFSVMYGPYHVPFPHPRPLSCFLAFLDSSFITCVAHLPLS